MSDKLEKLCETAAKIVKSYPKSTRIRVISHYDADGITAAGIIGNALYREGYNFHITLMRNPFNKGIERLLNEKNDLIIFSDMGSAQLEYLEKFDCKVIILDHHQLITEKIKDGIIQINANACNYDGNYEACGATLSYSFAVALNRKNEDLSSLALAGAIGDKQHIGGLKGLNKNILENALEKKLIEKRTGIKLYGDSIFNALFFTIDPFYLGLSGNKQEISNLLKKLDIKDQSKIEDIEKKSMIKLQSYLLFKLIKNGCEKKILDILIRERYYSKSLDCELERFSDLLDSCGKNGHRGIALSLCFFNDSVLQEALKVENEYRQKVLSYLLSLSEKGIIEKEGFRYFYSDDTSLGGVVAGIAVNYILDDKKPLFSVARKEDELHISCRGNQKLVENGLDLGAAMKEVTKNIGGFGGGHKIAAGGTFSIDKEEEFLDKINKILLNQVKV